jgi:hypothetical protein
VCPRAQKLILKANRIMGYVVCHIQKPKGNDAGTSAHIERRVHPVNAVIARSDKWQNSPSFTLTINERTPSSNGSVAIRTADDPTTLMGIAEEFKYVL